MSDVNYNWRKAKSLLMSLLCLAATMVVVLPVVLVLYDLFRLGAGALDWNFLTHLPASPGERGGGMANAIVGSLVLVGLAIVLGVPVGVLGGVYLAEFASPRANWAVRFAADILNGTPSIVWGIVVYALMVMPGKPLSVGFSAYAGGMALGFIMLPLVLRTTEEMLTLVPQSYREAALALGIPRWKSTLHIILKTAARGIVTGILLAAARVAGETAPLLFTALGNQFWSHKLSEPIAALPLQIFVYAIGPYADWHRQAWAGALVLVLAGLALNFGVRIMTRGPDRGATRAMP